MTPELVVIGSFMHDTGIRVDRFPHPGETITGGDRTGTHGGKGSNQAVQAARCGASVTMVGAVGDDSSGHGARQMWADEGLDISACVERKDSATGLALIMIDRSGQNQIVIDPGANATLTAADVDIAAGTIAKAKLVLAQLEVPDVAVLRAFQLARQHGVATMLNPAPARAIPDELWALTDYLVPNESEAALLANAAADTPVETLAAALLPKVARAVILTAGARGAFVFAHGSKPLHQAAPKINVVDTTGAGDAFIGGFVAQWLRDQDMARALPWGVAAGSLACGGRGCVPAFARKDAVAQLASTLVLS